MIGNTAPRVSNFQGFDLMTLDSDVNPFTASYLGAPFQVRATDPADYGRAAVAYLGGGPVSGPVTSAASGVVAGTWDKVKTGVSGVVLGIILVALGAAYILWGRD